MSLLAALTRRADPEPRSLQKSAVMQAWGRGDELVTDALAGVSVSRDTALGLSAVWACVSLIADSIATLPREAKSTDADGVRSPLADQPAWLEAPNPEQTGIDFIFGQVASLLLDGNAFIYCVRDRFGDVAQAWALDPNYVYVRREPKANGRGWELVYYVMVVTGQQSPVGPFRIPAGPDMFHIPAFTIGGNPRGLAPVEVQRVMLGGAIASQEMGARFFGQGMNAGGVIEVAGEMTIDQARELKSDFARANGGLSKMHLPPVLTGGASWKQMSISPEQAQFLEQREFTAEEIARWFRVPPYMIGLMSKTTTWGTGIEQQGIGFVTYTLRPWIERLEASWSRWLLLTRPGVSIEFNVNGLLRGDHEARGKWYAAGRQWGWLSVNDIRLTEGEPPIGPEGDVYLTPINMTSPKGFPAAEPLPTDQAPPTPEPAPTAGEG